MGTKEKDGPVGKSDNLVMRLVDDLPQHQNHKLFVKWKFPYSEMTSFIK
jgi:hypothetical protein